MRQGRIGSRSALAEQFLNRDSTQRESVAFAESSQAAGRGCYVVIGPFTVKLLTKGIESLG